MHNRLKKYLTNKNKPATVITNQEIYHIKDGKIDQDFPGFPYDQSKENIIIPSNATGKRVAAADKTDCKKISSEQVDEAAFGASEKVRE